MSAHVADCPDWAAAYAADPARDMDPAVEYARWVAEDQRVERVARRDAAIAVNDQRRTAQQGRFARLKDPLED